MATPQSFNPFLFLPPALCDMTGTSLMYVGKYMEMFLSAGKAVSGGLLKILPYTFTLHAYVYAHAHVLKIVFCLCLYYNIFLAVAIKSKYFLSSVTSYKADRP